LSGHPRALSVSLVWSFREHRELLFHAAEQLGLEAIIGKRADSPYVRGRTPNWVKVKTSAGRAIDEERAKWNE
jgi:ATP-dependent DNA ligase